VRKSAGPRKKPRERSACTWTAIPRGTPWKRRRRSLSGWDDAHAERNGVLIYLATDHRKFAIVGDEGIHRVVPENTWEDVKEIMQKDFRRGNLPRGSARGSARSVSGCRLISRPFGKEKTKSPMGSARVKNDL